MWLHGYSLFNVEIYLVSKLFKQKKECMATVTDPNLRFGQSDINPAKPNPNRQIADGVKLRISIKTRKI